VLSNIDQPDDSLDDEVVHLQSRKSAMTAITDFDPDAFLVVPARMFEDLRIGEVFRAPSRTLTDAHAAAFQTVSMDNHPVHYDAEWARTHGHVAPVVHGLQVLAFTAPGATLFPHFIGEVFISFVELSCTFLAEVHCGDTLYPALTITGLEPKGDDGIVVTAVTVHNQREQVAAISVVQKTAGNGMKSWTNSSTRRTAPLLGNLTSISTMSRRTPSIAG
jgi:acyl dehydratase